MAAHKYPVPQCGLCGDPKQGWWVVLFLQYAKRDSGSGPGWDVRRFAGKQRSATLRFCAGANFPGVKALLAELKKL